MASSLTVWFGGGERGGKRRAILKKGKKKGFVVTERILNLSHEIA